MKPTLREGSGVAIQVLGNRRELPTLRGSVSHTSSVPANSTRTERVGRGLRRGMGEHVVAVSSRPGCSVRAVAAVSRGMARGGRDTLSRLGADGSLDPGGPPSFDET